MSWFVACVTPQKDEKTVWRLRDKGFEVFWPYLLETKPPTRRRKAYEVRHSLFPSYLFINCEVCEIWKIEDVTGISRVMCDTEGNPLPVADSTIQTIKKRCDPSGEVYQRSGKAARRRFRKGEKIKTIDEDSPLFGLTLIVQDMLDSGNISATLAEANQMGVTISNPHRWETET